MYFTGLNIQLRWFESLLNWFSAELDQLSLMRQLVRISIKLRFSQYLIKDRISLILMSRMQN